MKDQNIFFLFQIDLDVNRTYRDHDMFRDRYNPRQNALFHVLAAYSVYNTEVGYCQVNSFYTLFRACVSIVHQTLGPAD